MKKYFAVVFLTILIIPSVASASWWNPFSWNIFRGTNTQIQIIENKIPDTVVKKVDTAKTVSTSTPKTTTKNKAELSAVKTSIDKPVKIECGIGYLPNSDGTACLDYRKYMDPTTGKIMTPKEYADYLAKKVQEMQKSSYKDTDPYNVSSDSSNAYSPEQMNAIDCAYYGTNCPTINVRIINN